MFQGFTARAGTIDKIELQIVRENNKLSKHFKKLEKPLKAQA